VWFYCRVAGFLVDSIMGHTFLVDSIMGHPFLVDSIMGHPFLVDSIMGHPFLVESIYPMGGHTLGAVECRCFVCYLRPKPCEVCGTH
jgi:hypothetical protein